MKKRFLTVYDYGQAAVWAFIHAGSPQEIERRFPELKVLDDVPEWMTSDEIEILEKRMTFDIDKPTGWLAKFEARSKRQREETATG